MLGGGRGDHDWLGREVALVAQRTDRPCGVGFKFAGQRSKLAGTTRGSYFALKNEY